MHSAVALADAGYDSEADHGGAREGWGIRSLIQATCRWHGAGPLKRRYRRLMRRWVRRGPDQKHYGQLWQAETLNRMVKRDFGSACREHPPWG